MAEFTAIVMPALGDLAYMRIDCDCESEIPAIVKRRLDADEIYQEDMSIVGVFVGKPPVVFWNG